MIRKQLVVPAMLLIAASLPHAAKADTIPLSFTGPGVNGTVVVTYGPTMDLKYPGALEVTDVSGTFTDTNNGLNIINAAIGALVPITHDMPEPLNTLAPNDFSRFAVGGGLPPENNGFLTYDNLFWPAGSEQTASDYPLHGGYLDIYGLMFEIGGGRVVDFWSNGTISGSGSGPVYGVAVATPAMALDYTGGVTVTVTPEPASIGLLGGGLVLLWSGIRQRRSADKRPV